MPRPGELTYFTNIGEEGRQSAVNKPFSGSPRLFMDLATILYLLPPPPARVLDCGCGTGWLTYFMARKGYDCLGTDVSAEAIQLARENPIFLQGGNVEFQVGDFEQMDFSEEFDAVVFFSSLHHAGDEAAAIQKTYLALRENGIFVAIEPGCGHEKASKHVIEKYDVGDKDMPPYHVIRLGRQAGFRRQRIYQSPGQLPYILYGEPAPDPLRRTLFRVPLIRYLALLYSNLFHKRYNGVVWMQK